MRGVMNYVELLKEAVEMFYARDAERLLRKVKGRSACERCIVNCIARYLWCLIRRRGLAVDVDVEYNLDCKSEDLKMLHASACSGGACKGCWMHEYLKGRVLREEENDNSLVYPDLIVHIRGTNKNYLAVEFKKEWAARDGSGAYTAAAKWDFAKLQYLACKKRKDGVRPYGKAVFVILKSDVAEFILPDQFPAVEEIGESSMDVSGRGGREGYFRP